MLTCAAPLRRPISLEVRKRRSVLALITEAAVATRILDCLGLDSTPPPLARARAPPEELEPPPANEGVDQVFPE